MKWTVVWSKDAEDDLAKMWLSAHDKASVTAAADRIDAQLKMDPLNTGQPYASDHRVHFDGPLGIAFVVDEGDRKVLVERIWCQPPDSKNGKQVHP